MVLVKRLKVVPIKAVKVVKIGVKVEFFEDHKIMKSYVCIIHCIGLQDLVLTESRESRNNLDICVRKLLAAS